MPNQVVDKDKLCGLCGTELYQGACPECGDCLPPAASKSEGRTTARSKRPPAEVGDETGPCSICQSQTYGGRCPECDS